MIGWLRKRFGGSTSVSRVSTDTSPDGTYSGLRHQALSIQREAIGLITPPIQSPVWGVLMETGYPTATATLFALVDGTTSLYLSSGGGVIGAQTHETVRKANGRFLEAANGLILHLKPTQSLPIPEAGQAIFYVRTDAGILTASAGQEELATGRHPLSPLFFAGHAVLTELRLLAESGKQSSVSSG